MNALIFLIETLFGFLTIAFLLRFYFQVHQVSFSQPVAQLVVKLTNFAVKPARRWMPALGKLDTATLSLAWLTQFCVESVVHGLRFSAHLVLIDVSLWWMLAGLAMLDLLIFTVYIYIYAIILQVLLSWLNPHHAMMPFLNQLTVGVLKYFRRLIPPVSGFDFSPIVFLLMAQMALNFFIIPFKNQILIHL